MSATLNQLQKVASTKLPATYTAARKALAACSKIDECKEWADKAAALASYAKQSKDDQLKKFAQRIQARALRRCGELLKQIPAARGANQNIQDGAVQKVTRESAATDAGLSERQRKTALRVANVPESTFTEQVESGTPPTITDLANWGKQSIKPPEAWLDDARELEKFARFCGSMNATTLAENIPAEKRNRYRAYVGEIDSWLDTFITSLA